MSNDLYMRTTVIKDLGSPNGNAGRLFERVKNSFAKGETPLFEGHLMPNEDEYQNLSG